MNLTDEELTLLDGKCRPEIQKEVEAAKRRLAMATKLADIPVEIAKLVADAVQLAKTTGELKASRGETRHCVVCQKNAGYAKRKRTSRDGFHRKGEPDYTKPLYLSAIDLGRGFIVFKGHITLGCCVDCWPKVKAILTEELAGVRAEIAESITGQPPRYKRYDKVKCKSCGWEGHEGLMLRHSTIMGDGTYPSGCPNCNQHNLFFGPRIIERADGFEIIEVPPVVKKEVEQVTF